MIQGAIILGIVFVILGSGVFFGKNISDSNWKTVYYTLAEQMSTMQSELNLEAEKAKGESNVIGAEITVIGEVSKVEEELMEQEVNHRVEQYLNNLLIAGMQPVPKEGDSSNQSGTTRTLSSSARASFERGGTDGLFADLDEHERRVIQRVLKKAELAQTEAIKRQIYLKNQEDKMKPLRRKN